MRSCSRLLIVIGGVLGLLGAEVCLTSCASEEGVELNPQPLPPRDPQDGKNRDDQASDPPAGAGDPVPPPKSDAGDGGDSGKGSD